MNKIIKISAVILGVTSIIFGAFGAHLLKKYLSVDQLVSFETGVRYQMYHAIFLLFVSLSSLSVNYKKGIFRFVIIGVVLFSGSIYLLSLKDLIGIDFTKIGFITPIGGLFLIFSWILLLIRLIGSKE